MEGDRLHFGLGDEAALTKAFRSAPVAPRLVAPGLAVLDDGFPREDPPALCAFLRGLLGKPGRTRQS